LVKLLITKGFNGVEVGGADGGDHATDEANYGENAGGNEDGDGGDDELDVGIVGVFGNGGVEGDAAHAKRDGVGEDNASEAADAGDGEGLGEELDEDVVAARAESLFDADFAGTLLNGDEHDVHESDAGDAKGERADEGEQDLEGDGDDGELMELRLEICDEDGAMVRGAKVMSGGEGGAEVLFDDFVVASIVEPDAVDPGGVFEVAHGGEGNPDGGVDVVFAFDHLGM